MIIEPSDEISNNQECSDTHRRDNYGQRNTPLLGMSVYGKTRCPFRLEPPTTNSHWRVDYSPLGGAIQFLVTHYDHPITMGFKGKLLPLEPSLTTKWSYNPTIKIQDPLIKDTLDSNSVLYVDYSIFKGMVCSYILNNLLPSEHTINEIVDAICIFTDGKGEQLTLTFPINGQGLITSGIVINGELLVNPKPATLWKRLTGGTYTVNTVVTPRAKLLPLMRLILTLEVVRITFIMN